MDKPNVETTIKTLTKLVKGGHTPKRDFSLNELEGKIAFIVGEDVSQRDLVAAMGALDVARKGERLWDRESFEERVSGYLRERQAMKRQELVPA